MRKFALLVIFMIASFSTTAIAGVQRDEPTVKAAGAVLMDAKTGRVLWGKNEHESLPMASTTKIMTAVVAIENGNMEDIVTVSRRAALSPKVKMNLMTGEKIKLQYLMYALMLESSNDAAVAIAEHIGGSVEDFCAMMTEKAKSLGAADTVFETPNGLDKGDHHSTAYDMALITRYALDNPEFVKLINTPEASFKSDKKSYHVMNKNRLLREFSGANGVKTGFTGKAGHCFVGAAVRDDMQLISVVLASGWGDKGKEQKWIDTKAVMNYGFNNFDYYDVIAKGTEVGAVDVERSRTEAVRYAYEQGINLPLSEEEITEMEIRLEVSDAVKAPVKPGDVLGRAECVLNGEIVAGVDLVSLDGAERHDYKTSLEKILNNWFRLGIQDMKPVILPEIGG